MRNRCGDPSGHRVIGCDRLEGPDEPLRFAALRPGAAGVRFEQADAYRLGASLGTFDAAIACLWFSRVPVEARGAFLASLHARLEPGARVVFRECRLGTP